MALIFDIKRYSINDGPGIRATVFLKGCPLHCVWCHNPESWSPDAQRLYKKSKCIGCQSCVQACPEGALKLTPDGIVPSGNPCLLHGSCAEACPALAMEISGKEWPLEELMAEIEKEREVIEESGGGVTLCGGEPLMHPAYCAELLDELGRRNFHRCVDTTLYASEATVRDIVTRCELLLVDLKLMDTEAHKRFTGVSNELILKNIQLVSELGVPFWIRIPLIEGVNADDANISASADFLAALPHLPEQVNLLPYHDIGKGKHDRMGTIYNPEAIPMSTPSDGRIEACRSILLSRNIPAIIGG